MTTQYELLELAEPHKEVPVINILLLSIKESQYKSSEALARTENTIRAYQRALLSPTGHVGNENLDLVTLAALAASSLNRLNADYLNLASVLQLMGVEISY